MQQTILHFSTTVWNEFYFVFLKKNVKSTNFLKKIRKSSLTNSNIFVYTWRQINYLVCKMFVSHWSIIFFRSRTITILFLMNWSRQKTAKTWYIENKSKFFFLKFLLLKHYFYLNKVWRSWKNIYLKWFGPSWAELWPSEPSKFWKIVTFQQEYFFPYISENYIWPW